MAEQEVIKHTKKIYKIWFSKEHSILHKISEFLLEIFIIVFAVTISIWFHNKSEYRHQQEEVREFLLGLKSDLTHDIREMGEDKTSYLQQARAFRYIFRLKLHETPNADSVRAYWNSISTTTQLNPNDGRFQGFKSSGRLGLIENTELQNDIMDLYQEDIPTLLMSTTSYVEIKKKLFDYMLTNGKRLTDSTTNFLSILNSDPFINIAGSLAEPVQVIERYNACIALMKKIVGEIDRAYDSSKS